MTKEQISAIALSYLNGVGPIRAKRMLAKAGSFEAVFELTDETLSELGISEAAQRALRDGTVVKLAERELELIARYDVQVIDCLSEAYPRRLSELADSPIVLYYRGTAKLDSRRTVGLVGTRKPTVHGRDACERLVEELSEYSVTTISGLAYGVDVTAHEASLRLGVPTIAVLAHGLAEIYPTAHRHVAQRMLEAGGGLLTEYPCGLRSRKTFFPQRNRIIAGLSDAVVVVESAQRGGSMITADLAAGYHTPVFAFPGRNRDAMSAGPNHLIKSHKAHLLQSASDIGYILGWQANDEGAATGRANLLFQTFEPEEQRIIDALKEHDDLDLDTLALRSELLNGELAAHLLELEFKGAIRHLPGKRYALAL